MKTYKDLKSLLQDDDTARAFYNSLPMPVREQIATRGDGVNSVESLKHYADNLTRGDL